MDYEKFTTEVLLKAKLLDSILQEVLAAVPYDHRMLVKAAVKAYLDGRTNDDGLALAAATPLYRDAEIRTHHGTAEAVIHKLIVAVFAEVFPALVKK